MFVVWLHPKIHVIECVKGHLLCKDRSTEFCTYRCPCPPSNIEKTCPEETSLHVSCATIQMCLSSYFYYDQLMHIVYTYGLLTLASIFVCTIFASIFELIPRVPFLEFRIFSISYHTTNGLVDQCPIKMIIFSIAVVLLILELFVPIKETPRSTLRIYSTTLLFRI